MSTPSVPPSTGLNADDAHTLRWKIHCLDLALGGLIHWDETPSRRRTSRPCRRSWTN